MIRTVTNLTGRVTEPESPDHRNASMVETDVGSPCILSSRWGEKRARRPLDTFAAGAQGVQPYGTALGAHGSHGRCSLGRATMPHSQPWVEAMKKPSRAGGKPAKALGIELRCEPLDIFARENFFLALKTHANSKIVEPFDHRFSPSWIATLL
jgi:hypothetical protein